jgi:hypothetical protein
VVGFVSVRSSLVPPAARRAPIARVSAFGSIDSDSRDENIGRPA